MRRLLAIGLALALILLVLAACPTGLLSWSNGPAGNATTNQPENLAVADARAAYVDALTHFEEIKDLAAGSTERCVKTYLAVARTAVNDARRNIQRVELEVGLA